MKIIDPVCRLNVTMANHPMVDCIVELVHAIYLGAIVMADVSEDPNKVVDNNSCNEKQVK